MHRCRALDQERAELLTRLHAEAEKQRCCICMSEQKGAMLFPCMHTDFCMTCVDRHMQRSNGCPLCRTALEVFCQQQASSALANNIQVNQMLFSAPPVSGAWCTLISGKIRMASCALDAGLGTMVWSPTNTPLSGVWLLIVSAINRLYA